jgi:hypothetical protein
MNDGSKMRTHHSNCCVPRQCRPLQLREVLGSDLPSALHDIFQRGDRLRRPGLLCFYLRGRLLMLEFLEAALMRLIRNPLARYELRANAEVDVLAVAALVKGLSLERL